MEGYKIVEISYLSEFHPCYYKSWIAFYKEIKKDFDFNSFEPGDSIIFNELDHDTNSIFVRRYDPFLIQRKVIEELMDIDLSVESINKLWYEVGGYISIESKTTVNKMFKFINKF